MGQIQNEPKNMALRTSAVLLCLCLISMWMISGTLARYINSDVGADRAHTASVVFDVNDESGNRLDLSNELKLNDLLPGKCMEMTFDVVNKKDEKISETAMEYSIAIETTGNLPLTYSLVSVPDGIANRATTKYGLAWSGGLLPASTDTSHKYMLTVEWPPDAVDAKYANEIDSVYLFIDAKQKSPQG